MKIITYGEIAKPDDIQEIHEYAEAYTSFNEASVEFSNITKLVSLYSEAAAFQVGTIIMSFLKLLLKLFGGVYVKAFAAIAALIGIAYKLTKGNSATVSVGGGGGGGSSSGSSIKTEIIESDGKKTITEESTVQNGNTIEKNIPLFNKIPLMIAYRKLEVKDDGVAPEVIDTINIETGVPEPQKVEEAPKVSKSDIKSWFKVLPTGTIAIVAENIDDMNLQKITSAANKILGTINKEIDIFHAQTQRVIDINKYDELLTEFESITKADNIVGLFDVIIEKIEAGETKVDEDLREKEKKAQSLIEKACSILNVDQSYTKQKHGIETWAKNYRKLSMLQVVKTDTKSIHAYISKNGDGIPLMGLMDNNNNCDGSSLLAHYLNGNTLEEANEAVNTSKKRVDEIKTSLSSIISKVDNKEIGRNEGELAAFTASFAQNTLTKLNTFMLTTQYSLEQVLKLFNAATKHIVISNIIVEKISDELSK